MHCTVVAASSEVRGRTPNHCAENCLGASRRPRRRPPRQSGIIAIDVYVNVNQTDDRQRGAAHDRPVRRIQGPRRVPPHAQGALRHGSEPVRRPRRRDQHHAAHPAGHGRRGRSTSATTARSTRSSPQRCRKTRRASRSAATRAATSSTSSTWSTCCAQRGGEHIQVFGGGGGVIVPAEIRELQKYGVTRIYSPEDGQRMGLRRHDRRDADAQRPATCRCTRAKAARRASQGHGEAAWRALAQLITALENGQRRRGAAEGDLHERAQARPGAGARHHRHRRRRQVQPDRRADPPPPARPGRRAAHRHDLDRPVAPQERRRAARRPHPHERDRAVASGLRGPPQGRSGWRPGAGPSASTCARSPRATPAARSARRCPTCSPPCKVAGFDLVIVETSGIGQGDAAIVPLVDVPLYVMTPEYGAASQLEKIDMLDFAEFVAINKFDRKGAADALRDVAKQVQRNREAFEQAPDEMPVFGTMASRFNDDGVTALYQALRTRLAPARPDADRGPSAACGDAPQHAPDAHRAGARARATWPRSPTPCAATRRVRASRPRWRARSQQLRASARMLADGSPAADAPPTRRSTSREQPRGRARRRRAEAARAMAATCSAPMPATSTW